MDIVVTVKQVPDPDIPPTHFKVDQATNKVIPPAGVAPVMNGYDAHALEAALRPRKRALEHPQRQFGFDLAEFQLGGVSRIRILSRILSRGLGPSIALPTLFGGSACR